MKAQPMRSTSLVQADPALRLTDVLPQIASQSRFELVPGPAWGARSSRPCEAFDGVCSIFWLETFEAEAPNVSEGQRNDSLPRYGSQNRIAAIWALHKLVARLLSTGF